jgi:hypothetical protein
MPEKLTVRDSILRLSLPTTSNIELKYLGFLQG